MVNQEILQGSWNELKGKLKSKWGRLTNDDLAQFDGNVEHLIGLIQRKSGETRATIEEYLDELTAEGESLVNRATDEVRRYAHDAAEMVHDGSTRAADALQQGFDETEEIVRRRPAESVAVGFGAGVLVGMLLGMIIHRR
jgi:uncharacterized protein YjbJ (UPF0337 family)